MQVHVYLDGEEGKVLVVEIPTVDGNPLVCRFNEADLSDSDHDNPLVGTMPEPTGSTQFAKPIGEMPLKTQEEYGRKVQEEQDARAREEAQRANQAASEQTTDQGASAQTQTSETGGPAPKEPASTTATNNNQLGAIDPVTLEPDGATDANVNDQTRSGNKPSSKAKK